MFRRIAICGVGLIGGSLGLAVRHRWPAAHVVGCDRRDVLDAALELGAIDTVATDLSAAADADLIVLSAPIVANRVLLRQLQTLGTRALVTDTGSTKRDIVAAAGAARFIGGHPVAGAAISGIRSARSDLFDGRHWILTPPDGGGATTPALRRFLEGIGARVRVMTAETHDRLLSAISHLPQLTASALMHVVGESAGEDGLALAGQGLRDTTRLASSPLDIWQEVVAANRDHLARDLDALITALQNLRDDLDAPDGALQRTFESAGAWKRRLDGRSDPA